MNITERIRTVEEEVKCFRAILTPLKKIDTIPYKVELLLEGQETYEGLKTKKLLKFVNTMFAGESIKRAYNGDSTFEGAITNMCSGQVFPWTLEEGETAEQVATALYNLLLNYNKSVYFVLENNTLGVKLELGRDLLNFLKECRLYTKGLTPSVLDTMFANF